MPTPTTTNSSDTVEFATAFSSALLHGIAAGWKAAFMRFTDAISTVVRRAATHFVIAGVLVVILLTLASGLVTTGLPWLPAPGPFWYVAAVGFPTSYFLIALALSVPRSARHAVLDGATKDGVVQSLMRQHFDGYQARFVAERERVMEAALLKARSVSESQGRQAGFEQARKELETDLSSAVAAAYERGRQAGEADKEHATDQAFERGLLTPRV